MALDSTGLITADEYRAFIGLNDDDKTINNDRIEAFINMASAWFHRATNRSWISAEYTEYRDGNGLDYMTIRVTPITVAPTISYLTDAVNGTWEEATSASWPRDVANDTGVIHLYGQRFTPGRRNWKIVYTGGYARAAIPADIKYALIAPMVQRALARANKQEGLKSQAIAGASTTYDFGMLLNDSMKPILNAHVYAGPTW